MEGSKTVSTARFFRGLSSFTPGSWTSSACNLRFLFFFFFFESVTSAEVEVEATGFAVVFFAANMSSISERAIAAESQMKVLLLARSPSQAVFDEN